MSGPSRISWQTSVLMILLCVGAALTFNGWDLYNTGYTTRPRHASVFWKPEPVSHEQALHELVPGGICAFIALVFIMIRYFRGNNDSGA